MILQKLLLALIGVSAGWLVSAGVFAFIVMIGVVTRMAAGSNTAKYATVYEDMVVLGGTAGSLLTIFQPQLALAELGLPLLLSFGLFSGIYAGCLAIALAEIIQAFPVFTRRIRLRVGLPFVVLSFALGKTVGALAQFLCQ